MFIHISFSTNWVFLKLLGKPLRQPGLAPLYAWAQLSS